jgi:putative ABC transport system ATP-binding protein
MSEERTKNIVEVRNVKRHFRLGKETVKALDGISLDIPRNAYVSILGPSGSGKSTLFNIIGGLDRPTEGEIRIDGLDLGKLAPEELAYVRCVRIGYIFQTYNLIPVMTALENVSIPMTFAGLSEKDSESRATEILERVGLGGKLGNTPNQLSGGQQQRVAIARALANDPSIILADEPTGNLDSVTGEEIIMLLKKLCNDFGVTVISATHDFKMMSNSDFIVWIRDGKLEKIEERSQLRIQEGSL